MTSNTIDLPARGLFVTGTDTGVGKTCVAALIARECREQGLRVGAYKPVCSGAELNADGERSWSDVEILSRATEHHELKERICPQRFVAPIAPPQAARREGREVDAGLLRQGAAWWKGRVELLLVEGVGGLLCPLSEVGMVADLAAELRYPLIIVVRLGLGCINHTLLTVEAARSRKLSIAGIVLNEVDADGENAVDRGEPLEIARLSNERILGRLQFGQPDRLIRDGDAGRMNWWDLASPKDES